MQTLRHLLYLIIVIAGAIVLSTCSVRQLNDNINLVASPSSAPSSQPTLTPSATRTPKIEGETPMLFSTYALTPTLDIVSFANAWTRYHGNYGITFEYPSVYDEKPFDDMCKAVESLDGADFGERSEVYVRQPLGTTLDEHVKSYLANLQFDEPFKLESQEQIEINEQPAIVIKYRLGKAAESREFVFFAVPESNVIYTFSFIGGSGCDMPEIELSERTVFEHAIETFYVEK